MSHKIIYKNIRNWYARINTDWNLEITIPTYLRFNKSFEARLIAKWEHLLAKYQKRTHIQTSGSDFVMLFGEMVPREDIWEHKNINKHLAEILKDYSIPILDKYCKMIGYNYSKLTVRKTTAQRWSCTSDQCISLNLQLVHLPTQFIKYVIVHEICHLQHKNHWKNFRNLVEKLFPNYKDIRKELKNFVLK